MAQESEVDWSAFASRIRLTPPTEIKANLRYRRALLLWAAEDTKRQHFLREVCRRDPIFFCNTFIWGYDPRETTMPKRPFVAHPKQVEIIEALTTNHKSDIQIEKSRGTGGTYTCLIALFHMWLFRDKLSFLLTSQKQDYVDQKGNKSTLFGKLDDMLDGLPVWLRPKAIDRTSLKLRNLDTGTAFHGESTHPDTGRGSRFTVTLNDEWSAVENAGSFWASIRGTSNCCVLLGTSRGTTGPGEHFYRQTFRTDMRRFKLMWWDHPEMSKGMYYDAKGKRRSPWYDTECKRCSAREVAQEIDGDYEASDNRFFNPDQMNLLNLLAVDPVKCGTIDFSHDFSRVDFIARPDGVLKIYKEGVFPHLVAASDISYGTGASNSCTAYFDRETGEQVAELVTPDTWPEKFARMMYAAAKLLSGPEGEPRFIWERNSPGRTFGKLLTAEVGIDPASFYYNRSERGVTDTITDLPGWHSEDDAKLSMLHEFQRSLCDGAVLPRSKMLAPEAACYQWKTGKTAPVFCSNSGTDDDPSGAGGNHGDRLIATALATKYINLLGPVNQQGRALTSPPENSMAGRLRMGDDDDAE